MKVQAGLVILLSSLLSTSVHSTEVAGQVEPLVVKMAMIRTMNSYYGILAHSIYQRAFDRLGVKLEMITCEPLECALNVRRGLVDGELARSVYFAEKFPELVRVEEPALSIVASAFSTSPMIAVDGFSSLRNSGYRVAYMRGYFLLDNELEKLKQDVVLVKVAHWKDGLKKLSSGEVDVFVGVEKTVLLEMARNRHSRIRKAGEVSRIPVHAYLQKRHDHLALQLSDMIKQMKQNGSISRLEKLVDDQFLRHTQ